MNDATPQLVYGRRRRFRWLWVELVLVVAAAISLSLNSERLHAWRAELAFRYWQHQCATWSLPPDVVVYEEDERRAMALRQQSAERYTPVFNADIVHGPQLPTGYAPPRAQQIVWGDEYFPTTLFMHARKVRAQERLVLVDAHLEDGHPREHGRTLVLWVRDKGFAASVGASGRGDGHSIDLSLTASDVLRLFAGECDVNDESAFRIRYELNGLPGFIEGRPAVDGSFRLRISAGPLHRYTGSIGIP